MVGFFFSFFILSKPFSFEALNDWMNVERNRLLGFQPERIERAFVEGKLKDKQLRAER